MRINAPKQTRSRATLERISAAAVELIGEQGVEATTVAQIVARAESSVGSFYARFNTKEDLLEYLRVARERIDFVSEHAERWSIVHSGDTIDVVFTKATGNDGSAGDFNFWFYIARVDPH